jgi:hypothetical protein
MRRHAALLAMTVLVAAACTTEAPEPTLHVTPVPTSIPSAELDPRLEAPLAEIAAHPEWTGTARPPFAVRKVAVSIDDLCMEVTADGGPAVTVAVDVVPATWRVDATGWYEPPDGVVDAYTRFERDTFESCASVLGGPIGNWPTTADGVVVIGGSGYPLDEAMVPALRKAVFDDPAAFGLERVGRPELGVAPLQDCSKGTCEFVDEPSPGLVCLGGGASYGAGTVAAVGIGLRKEADGWKVVSVRLASQALSQVEKRAPDGC